MRDALNEGVNRGWLVWRENEQRKEYALHLKEMHVSENGEFLGTVEELPMPEPSPSTFPPEPVPEAEIENNDLSTPLEEADGTKDRQIEIAQLLTQVATLTKTLNGLLHLLCAAGIDVRAMLSEENTASMEASKAPSEASKALAEASKAPDGSKRSASYTNTDTHL